MAGVNFKTEDGVVHVQRYQPSGAFDMTMCEVVVATTGGFYPSWHLPVDVVHGVCTPERANCMACLAC